MADRYAIYLRKSRADMDNWQLKVYEKLKPMENILMNHIKSGPVINMDETTVKVLKYENAEKNKDRKKILYVVGMWRSEEAKSCDLSLS